MKRYAYLLLFLVSILLCLGALSTTDSFRSVSDSSRDTEKDWEALVRAIGGERAYAELSKRIASFDEEKKHTEAHLFGAALYAAEGVSGLSVCDSQFSFGCFHEFLGRAIADLGIASVSELNETCFKDLGPTGLSCQHGIGHGVQAYFGYERENLDEALDACEKLSGTDPIGGCYGGVFMEYNFQTMLGKEGRMREEKSSLEPCDTIESPYTEACIFAQPQWWYQGRVEHVDRSSVFAELGELCTHLADEKGFLRTCFSGIGNIAPQAAGYDPLRTRLLCGASSNDPVLALSCLATAANSIGVTKSVARGLEVCSGLSGESHSFCLAYARNEANVFKNILVPEVL